jgi:endoglucanase
VHRLLLPLVLALAIALALALVAGPAGARTAPTDNPLAGHRWGVYTGSGELSWAPYARAKGRQKELLGEIALQPKAKWFGAWIPDDQIAGKVREYVANATGGDPEVLVQLTVFRMVPWEQQACRRLPTAAEQASYRRWIKRFARALGDARAAVVVQPDGPFAQCAPGGSTLPSELVAFATRRLAAQPNTTVYVEGGSASWARYDPARTADLLVAGGVADARGFHLGTTHYESVDDLVRFGAQVVDALAARGLPGKHFTVDTAENGRPFTYAEHVARYPAKTFNNAPTCRSTTDTQCVTLGIPPTTEVADPRWGLPADVAALAASYVDAYLWAGRPWLHFQSDPFDRKRALALARTTPY